MFIGRRSDGSIYGAWTTKQANDEFHPGMEELADDHPDVADFMTRSVAVDKRELAIDALLTATAKNADAPQAVKDFAASEVSLDAAAVK